MGVRDASQCTFWCSVLSDTITYLFHPQPVGGLNAPFGAQCFPTRTRQPCRHKCRRLNAPFGAQCFPTGGCCRRQGRVQLVSMHLLVLSAFRQTLKKLEDNAINVSMHLLVLSAFRPTHSPPLPKTTGGLNAPFGAQCFPTLKKPWSMLNRISSQCTFWCSVLSDL